MLGDDPVQVSQLAMKQRNQGMHANRINLEQHVQETVSCRQWSKGRAKGSKWIATSCSSYIGTATGNEESGMRSMNAPPLSIHGSAPGIMQVVLPRI